MKPIVEVWPHEDRPLYAVRADQASVAKARAAVRRQYDSGLPLRYVGIQVVNLPEREGLRGRRRRAHIFTDEPS